MGNARFARLRVRKEHTNLKNNLTNLPVSLSFLGLADAKFLVFAENASDCLAKNDDSFKGLPVAPADLKQLCADFRTKLNANVDRSRTTTAAKNASRATLQTALRKDALFVEIVAHGDENMILKAGFVPVSTNRTPETLKTPEIKAVEYGQSGEVKVRIKADRNARSFQGRYKEATAGEFGPVVSFASSRKILFAGLKAGVTYVFELCAVGGSTGQSDWTEPFTKMAI